ncbi:ABC transporter permease [Vannielia litorea]|uniref:ABC transporter permease n=1 Tax=Vannielia litorea TaxID=1217970 RepID=UPI001BCDA09C|nr:ABC transporter permease [Vannielia litorea]MBS8225573.1 ABC transporter permease [Vannielia litorea]
MSAWLAKRGGWLWAYAVAYLVFLYAPIFLLPLFAFNDSTVIAFPLQGFTTEWFKGLTGVPALTGSVKTSLIIAVTSSVLATLLGLCAARAGVRYRFPGKGPILGLIMVPLVLPEIIVGVSLLVVIVSILGAPLSSWTVILGHTLICTPFAVAILNASYQSLDTSLEEAAIDLGETPASTFRLVTLPLIMPGIVASLLISFTISLDEFIIAFFLTGAEPTLPVYIWSQLRFPQKLPIIMALGTILVAASVVLLTLAEIMRRRGLRRAGAKDTGGFL